MNAKTLGISGEILGRIPRELTEKIQDEAW